MDRPQNLRLRPNGLAIASLALVGVSLIAYLSVTGNSSPRMFVVVTIGASVAGVVSLALAILACKRGKRKGAKPKIDLLATVSIAVAVGYLICMAIMLLNIVVYWLRA